MRKWIGGLISVLSGGIVTGITTMVVDSAKFNFQDGVGNVAIVALFSAVVALLNYLAKSPLPEPEAK